MGETRSRETEGAVRIALPSSLLGDGREVAGLTDEPACPAINMTKRRQVIALQTVAAIRQDEVLNRVVRPT